MILEPPLKFRKKGFARMEPEFYGIHGAGFK